MRKITGKVVSLVLALALVVTSFSGTFAFAATKSETVVVTPDNETLYFAAGDFAKDSNVSSLLTGKAKTYDHQDVAVRVVEAARQSGNDLVTITSDKTTGVVNFRLKSTSASGTEVIAVRYTGDLSTNRPEQVTVNGIANITVKVLAKDAIVIGESKGDLIKGDGKTYPKAIADFNKNETVPSKDYSVYKVSQDSQGILPVFTAQSVVFENKHVNDTNYVVSSNPDKFVVSSSTDKSFKITPTLYANEKYLRIGNVAIKANKGSEAGKLSNAAADMVTSVAKVTNTIKIGADKTSIFQWHGATWAAKTTLDEKSSSKLTDAITKAIIPVEDAINVSGSDIAISANTAMFSGSVGKVSGKSTFSMENGYVASVGDDVEKFTMTKGNVGKVEAKEVEINGGKAGDISAATSIKINATDEKVPTIVGSLTSASITVGTTTAAAVATGKITAGSSTEVTISGNKTTVGAIDLNYYASTVKLDNFKGSIATPLNAKLGGILTSGTTDATVKGAIDIPSIVVNADTKLRIHDSVRVENISGAGVFEITAGKLYVKNSISGVSLKLANAFKIGDSIFSADAYKVYEGSFNTVGFTTEKTAGTTVDTFKVKTVDFANVQLNKASSKIALNNKETFTVSNYPVGTKLPEGYTVKFSFDGGDDYFTFTSTATTATVEAKKFEKTFTSLNRGTLTATVYDQYGFQAYGFAPATCDVEIIEKPEAVSDTNNDFSVASGSSYQFKITSSTVPVFTLGTGGVFTVAPVSHVAGSNDYFYKITATGKVGAATGVFLNGNKLLVATVKAPAFKSDTVKDFTVKGAYQFKITAPVTPTFTVGTAGVFKAEFVNKVGNDYFYKITSVGAVGKDAGIYVNGAKLLVAKVG